MRGALGVATREVGVAQIGPRLEPARLRHQIAHALVLDVGQHHRDLARATVGARLVARRQGRPHAQQLDVAADGAGRLVARPHDGALHQHRRPLLGQLRHVNHIAVDELRGRRRRQRHRAHRHVVADGAAGHAEGARARRVGVEAAGQLEQLTHGARGHQLVDPRPAHAARDLDRQIARRHVERVTVEHLRVLIDLPEQREAREVGADRRRHARPVDLDAAERAGAEHAARLRQDGAHARQRARHVGAGANHRAGDVDEEGARPRQRQRRVEAGIDRPQPRLDAAAQLRQRAPARLEHARARHEQSPLRGHFDLPLKLLQPPQHDAQLVARSDDIAGGMHATLERTVVDRRRRRRRIDPLAPVLARRLRHRRRSHAARQHQRHRRHLPHRRLLRRCESSAPNRRRQAPPNIRLEGARRRDEDSPRRR